MTDADTPVVGQVSVDPVASTPDPYVSSTVVDAGNGVVTPPIEPEVGTPASEPADVPLPPGLTSIPVAQDESTLPVPEVSPVPPKAVPDIPQPAIPEVTPSPVESVPPIPAPTAEPETTTFPSTIPMEPVPAIPVVGVPVETKSGPFGFLKKLLHI